MLKSTALTLSAAAVFAATTSARAETVSADRDTYVRANNDGPYGTEKEILVSANKENKKVRKGLVAFRGPVNTSIVDAKLELTVAQINSNANFLIYGVRDSWAALMDGTSCPAENFDENIKYNNSSLSFLDGSDGGVVAGSPCVFGGKPLGTLAVPKSKLNSSVTFTSSALVNFLQENANTPVAFLIVRAVSDKGDDTVGFASHRHTSLPAPRLSWTTTNGIEMVDASGATPRGSNAVDYRGTLRIPLAGGKAITVPAADVRMNFNAAGDLISIDGTVGFPTLPDQGLMSALGGGDTTGTSLQIGYGLPISFNGTAELPLRPLVKHFYFRQLSGASVSFGPVSASSPDAGETVIAVDPLAPALFFHSDQMGGSVVLDSARMGVSGAKTIAFDPSVTRGVESYMTPFDGNLYLGGSGAIPTSIPTLFVTVDGDLTIDAKPEVFPTGDWAKTIGGNADIGLEVSIGVFALSLPVSQSSLLYRTQGEGGSPSFAFSGNAYDPGFSGLPFQMADRVKVAGYFTDHNAGRSSFVQLDGRMDLGNVFKKHQIEGTLLLDSTGGSFSGDAKFGGQKMSVSGAVTNVYVKLTGSMSNSFNFDIGKIKTKVFATFDTRSSGAVGLSASAQFCVDGAGCSGAGIDDLSIKSDGSVRICVKVAGIGTSCQTL